MDTRTSRHAATRATLLAVALLGALAASAAFAASPEPPASWDGLQPIQVKGLDHAYARPGATLAAYRRIQLDPVEVSFSKNWRPERDDLAVATRVTQADRDRIRRNLAALVTREFSKDIARNGGYPVVTEAGPDVLRVRAHIVDLYINAPDVAAAGRVRSYVRSAGSMTLMVELFDSETGQLIARAVDSKVDPENSWLTLADSVTNSAAAGRAVDAWTRILRRQLDGARVAVSGSPATG